MEGIVAQAIGFVGTAFLVAAYQQRTRKGILLLQIAASMAFMVHFFLLGTYTGCLMNVLGAVRCFVYSQRDKRWAQSRLWLVFFMAAFALAGVLTADTGTYWWLLPTAAMLLSSVSFWLKNETAVRMLSFPASPMWLVYNFAVGSYSGILTECFVMTSLLVAIVRYDVLKKKKVTEA